MTNSGLAALIVSGVEAAGANAGDYLIADGCQQPVTPGGSCQIGVRFSPQALGASSATLTVLTNAPTAPSAVTLAGTGSAPGTGPAGPPPLTGPRDPRARQVPPDPRAPRGAPGPAGPAVVIVCQSTPAGKVPCSLLFTPAIPSTPGNVKEATFRIQRAGPTATSGTLVVKRGKISSATIGKLRRGRYTLIISAGHGHHSKLLLRYVFQVP